MVQTRRFGSEDSQVRTRFLDAAEGILSKGGDHAFSARTIAAEAGLKTQLLYYYFRTLDELLLAVIRRVGERRVTGFENALASPEPLRALWESMADPANAGLATAITAIASRNPVVREEIVESARRFRVLQTEAVARLLPATPAGQDPASPAGLVLIAAALARMLVTEQALGLSQGHAEARAMVDAMLERLRPPG
ncbi:MAG: TetR family transcriptional regulator [Novosphingobium sp.]